MATTITEILNTWAQAGVFAYVLPFLIIFAIIFGILNKSQVLGNNKGVQATLAIAIGLISLQFDLVSNFFANIFPYLGMGIAILLAALILLGLGTEGEKWGKYIWLVLGIVIFFVVIASSFSSISFLSWSSPFFQQYGTLFFTFLFIAVLIWFVVKQK